MLLAIDAGNTNVVFALFDGEKLRGAWRAATDPKRTADEYAVWLTQLMSVTGVRPADVSGAIIASVVPAARHALTSLCRRHFRVEPLEVGAPEVDLGIDVEIDRPEEVGEDRLVNARAAYDRYGGPLIIVDFGTATTFDVIGDRGAYEGGIIAPGINLSVEALYQAAAQLPRSPVERPGSVIGKATVPAMKSGVYWGYVGLIEGLIARVRAERGGNLRVIATGGLAPLFAEATDAIDRVDPDLTLHGLLAIYRANREAQP